MSPPAAPTSYGAAATDPGFDAVESLYRGATGRSGLGGYEPSLRPPEGTLDYGWLFRPDEPEAAPSSEPLLRLPRPPRTTTPSPVTVRGADPAVHWSPGTQPAGRRWPAAALLAATVTCALLLPWVLRAL